MRIDVQKAFDHNSREHVVVLAALMGCPVPVVSTWFRMWHDARIVSVFAEGVG